MCRLTTANVHLQFRHFSYGIGLRDIILIYINSMWFSFESSGVNRKIRLIKSPWLGRGWGCNLSITFTGDVEVSRTRQLIVTRRVGTEKKSWKIKPKLLYYFLNEPKLGAYLKGCLCQKNNIIVLKEPGKKGWGDAVGMSKGKQQYYSPPLFPLLN